MREGASVADTAYETVKAALAEGRSSVRLTLVHDSLPDPKAFGSRFADFDGPGFRLRLTLDRGFFGVTAADPTELDEHGETAHWYPLHRILEFVGEDPQAAEYGEIVSLPIIETGLTHLVTLFRDWPAQRAPLEEFLQRRFEERLQRLDRESAEDAGRHQGSKSVPEVSLGVGLLKTIVCFAAGGLLIAAGLIFSFPLLWFVPVAGPTVLFAGGAIAGLRLQPT
jgi:hypothetical protein